MISGIHEAMLCRNWKSKWVLGVRIAAWTSAIGLAHFLVVLYCHTEYLNQRLAPCTVPISVTCLQEEGIWITALKVLLRPLGPEDPVALDSGWTNYTACQFGSRLVINSILWGAIVGLPLALALHKLIRTKEKS